MQVTARNKMHFAVPGEASYSGQRPQTTYFHHRDPAEIASNRGAAKRLISTALDSGSRQDRQESRLIFFDIAAESVLTFVRDFTFHPDTELRSGLLERYISEQQRYEWLEYWNLAVITRRPPAKQIDLGCGQVNLLTRSKLERSSNATTANIGTLMSKPDRVADLINSAAATSMDENQLLDARTESRRGLILLYPIDKDSEPKPHKEGYRIPLDAIDHLMGAAFSFPRAAPESRPKNLIQVDMPRAEPTEEAEPEDVYVDDEGDRDDVDLSDA
jgi:hypothetical protein